MKKDKPQAIIIASYGKTTMVLCNGELYGYGIEEINFHHEAGGNSVLSVICDRLPLLPEDSSPEKMEEFKKFLEELEQKEAVKGEKSPLKYYGNA